MNGYRTLVGLLLGRRLPLRQGTLRVLGVRGEVVIRRDDHGVPHIEASNDADALFGLGFCQGQDRAFQIEFLKRLAGGRLAELVGKEALPLDRLARRVGFRRGAKEQLAALDSPIRELVEAFAQGASQGASQGLPRVPHEFVLLRSRPTPLLPEDLVALARLMAFLLASNWDMELARFQILLRDGPRAVVDLDPAYATHLPPIASKAVDVGRTVDRLGEDLRRFAEVAKLGGASNAWAVGGLRTTSGKPLLANDPHLAPTLPPHWYLVHLATSDWAVAGASFVGLPAILAGHNGHGAWGVTAGLLDNTDLYLEQLDGRRCRRGEEWVDCQLVEETIAVRGGPPVMEEVLITPHGPVVSPAFEALDHAISLRATWLESRPWRGFLEPPRARSFEAFRQTFRDWPQTPLSVVWADTSGTVGWQLTGAAPRRRAGSGLLPSPAWDPACHWEAEGVPFEEMPHLTDPEVGFVVSANNQPVPPGAGPYLGSDWLSGYRAARLSRALEERRDWDVDTSQKLQLDVLSLLWHEVRERVLAAPADDEAAMVGHQLLAGWDGTVEADSSAATVFEFLIAELAGRIAIARAPNSAAWALGKGFHPLVPYTGLAMRRPDQVARLLREQPPGWLPRSWPEEIGDALAATVRRLRQRFGDPQRWAWGRVRPLVLQHPLGRQRPLDRIFNLGPLPGRGDTNTPAQAAVDLADPTAPPFFIPSLRMVIAVGEWSASRFALPGGQSGNPLSPHYADQLPLWSRGSGIPIPWTPDEVLAATRATLRLLPAQ